MHILFVVPYAPTPIRTRSYNLVRFLARRGHTITLAALWENAEERAALEQLKNEGIRVLAVQLTKLRSMWNCLRAIPTAVPLQAVYCWQPELLEELGSIPQVPSPKFDVIHVEHLRGAQYGIALQPEICISAGQTPMVWDSVDCISHLFEQAARNSHSQFGRLVTRFDLPRTRTYEAWLTKQFDQVLASSPADAAALQAFAHEDSNLREVTHERRDAMGEHQIQNSEFPQSSRRIAKGPRPAVTVLPNGVDLDYFSPSRAPREPTTIAFSGKMSYHANASAALHLVKDIMPLVWKECPDCRVEIVGKDPPSQVRRLVKRAPSKIMVTGTVADLRPYLQRATLAVAPILYGAGIQNKVLEAMACATPVVATPQAAIALRANPEEHFLVGEDAAAFANQILRLLENQDQKRRIGDAGRRYVEIHHDWHWIVEHLEEIYGQAIRARQRIPSIRSELFTHVIR